MTFKIQNIILILYTFALIGCGNSQNATLQTKQNDSINNWSAWVNSLTNKGYSVTQGGVDEVDNAACTSIVNVFGTCFGNNAAAPYLVPQVPITNSSLNTAYTSTFNATGVTGAATNMFYKLADNEALLVIINLPPKAAYMGYQSYVFGRAVSYYPGFTGSYPQAYTPDKSRAELFASLGNDINNVVVANQAGSSWSGNVVTYITTSNQYLKDALIASAKSYGLNSKYIFTEPIGSNVMTGIEQNSDDLITLIRYAMPQDTTAANAWSDNLSSNILTYKISLSNIPISRFGAPSYSTKPTVDESAYRESLDELSVLLAAWLTSVQSKPTIIEPMKKSEKVENGQIVGLIGQDCITKGNNCLGDNQDTDAYRIGAVGALGNSQTAIITGVNHALTNAANYVSLSIYNMDTFTGVASVSQSNPTSVGFNSGTLTGSATAVLQTLNLYRFASDKLKADLPMLYVSLLSRECKYATDYCISVSESDAPKIAVTQRAYVKPGDTTGTNPDYLLTPFVILAP